MTRKRKQRCETCSGWCPPLAGETYGGCRTIPDSEETALAFTWDYESYRSGLSTQADFGCALWTAATGDKAP